MFRKVREAGRMNVLQFSSKSDLTVPSYDQQAKKVNDEKSQRLVHCDRNGILSVCSIVRIFRENLIAFSELWLRILS